MNKNKEHWRSLAGKEFLIGEELAGKEVTLTIKSVATETLQNASGTEKKPVMAFEKTDRKLVLNVTNMDAIAQELGTPYPADWAGREITLYPIRGTFFGKEQDAIRIKRTYDLNITPNKA